jgi:hypothetical protein
MFSGGSGQGCSSFRHSELSVERLDGIGLTTIWTDIRRASLGVVALALAGAVGAPHIVALLALFHVPARRVANGALGHRRHLWVFAANDTAQPPRGDTNNPTERQASYQKHVRPRGRLQRRVRHSPLRHSPQHPNLYSQTNTAHRENPIPWRASQQTDFPTTNRDLPTHHHQRPLLHNANYRHRHRRTTTLSRPAETPITPRDSHQTTTNHSRRGVGCSDGFGTARYATHPNTPTYTRKPIQLTEKIQYRGEHPSKPIFQPPTGTCQLTTTNGPCYTTPTTVTDTAERPSSPARPAWVSYKSRKTVMRAGSGAADDREPRFARSAVN